METIYTMELVKPRRLHAGDKIRIVAPASIMDTLDKNIVEKRVEKLKQLDFKVKISPFINRHISHMRA